MVLPSGSPPQTSPVKSKSPGRGLGSPCATALAHWVSNTLVVNASSYHHRTSILCPRKPPPCGSLTWKEGEKERNQEKGNPLPAALQLGFSGVSHHPGQTGSLEATILHEGQSSSAPRVQHPSHLTPSSTACSDLFRAALL